MGLEASRYVDGVGLDEIQKPRITARATDCDPAKEHLGHPVVADVEHESAIGVVYSEYRTVSSIDIDHDDFWLGVLARTGHGNDREPPHVLHVHGGLLGTSVGLAPPSAILLDDQRYETGEKTDHNDHDSGDEQGLPVSPPIALLFCWHRPFLSAPQTADIVHCFNA